MGSWMFVMVRLSRVAKPSSCNHSLVVLLEDCRHIRGAADTYRQAIFIPIERSQIHAHKHSIPDLLERLQLL